MKISPLLLLASFFLPAVLSAKAPIADKPLFRDPVYDGAADPCVVWNPHTKTWWMLYANHRANVPGLRGTTWVHGSTVGIAESTTGGATWKYVGTANIEMPAALGGDTPTFWGPHVVTGPDGLHHLFLTVVPGIFDDFDHPRTIVHLTSTDLQTWRNPEPLKLASDRARDAAVYPLPNGGWRLWYNNESDNKSIYYADSPDLNTWTDCGKCTSVNEPVKAYAGPFVFRWRNDYWMIVDTWRRGLCFYRSSDLQNWSARGYMLMDGAKGKDDSWIARHPCVVVNGEHAYLFYFTHPGGYFLGAITPIPLLDWDDMKARRSLIQVGELYIGKSEFDGRDRLDCDRDKPVKINLSPPPSTSSLKTQ